MKKRYIIFGITLLILLATNVSAEPLDTLEYEETKMVMIQGNVTLNLSVTPTGNEDVILLFRLYDKSSNVTVYNVQSKTITYDENFVNDSKWYIFAGSDGNDYEIGVDYSSIDVPPGIEEIIAEYEARINEHIINNTILLGDLIDAREALNQTLSDLAIEQNKTEPLLDTLANQSSIINQYEMKFEQMNTEMTFYKNEMNKYKDVWNFHPNYPSIIITILVILVIFGFLWSRKNDRPFPGMERVQKMFKDNKQGELEDDPGQI